MQYHDIPFNRNFESRKVITAGIQPAATTGLQIYSDWATFEALTASAYASWEENGEEERDREDEKEWRENEKKAERERDEDVRDVMEKRKEGGLDESKDT